VKQARAQFGHRTLPVVGRRSLSLTRHDDPRGQMSEPYGMVPVRIRHATSPGLNEFLDTQLIVWNADGIEGQR
jgi:hypothetical protein